MLNGSGGTLARMLGISHWWNLRKFKRKRRAIREDFAKKARQLAQKETKNPYAYSELQADEYFEDKMMEETVAGFLSNRILEQAFDYDVEVPSPSERKEWWQYTDDGEHCYLNAEGRAVMRDLIHKEQERNTEDWKRWAQILAPVIGALAALFGAATGLVLAFKK